MAAPWWIGTFGGLALLAGAVGVVAQLAHRPLSAAPINQVTQQCAEPPVWSVGASLQSGGVQLQGDEVRFGGEGYVYTYVCSPGLLTMQAAPVKAGGAWPRLLVVQGGHLLSEQVVARPGPLTVDVPQAGQVALVYPDHYYRAEVVAAALRHLRQPGCVPTVEAPARRWTPESQLLQIVGGDPVTIRPCREGHLQFDLSGDHSPRLRFVQDGTVLLETVTGDAPQRLDIVVGAGPITARILNPRAQVLEHRRLTLTALDYHLPRQAP